MLSDESANLQLYVRMYEYFTWNKTRQGPGPARARTPDIHTYIHTHSIIHTYIPLKFIHMRRYIEKNQQPSFVSAIEQLMDEHHNAFLARGTSLWRPRTIKQKHYTKQ